jgi:hypothetical protein
MPAPAEIRVRGTLMETPAFQCTPTEPHQGYLRLVLNPNTGSPVIVVQHLGTDGRAHAAASAKANSLRRGDMVEAYGTGLLAQPDHGHACIRLLGVRDVIFHPTTHPTEADHERTH